MHMHIQRKGFEGTVVATDWVNALLVSVLYKQNWSVNNVSAVCITEAVSVHAVVAIFRLNVRWKEEMDS
jgi:hypothetical protein